MADTSYAQARSSRVQVQPLTGHAADSSCPARDPCAFSARPAPASGERPFSSPSGLSWLGPAAYYLLSSPARREFPQTDETLAVTSGESMLEKRERTALAFPSPC